METYNLELMQEKLNTYLENPNKYIFVLNMFRDENWTIELGKYIYNECENLKHLFSHLDNFITEDSNNNMVYLSIAINLLTIHIDNGLLEVMFGKPLMHNEFGEGFKGEWDEYEQCYKESTIEELCASYFVNVDGTNFLISYDYRGTIIQIEQTGKLFDYSNENAQKCFDAVKKLIDLCNKNILELYI